MWSFSKRFRGLFGLAAALTLLLLSGCMSAGPTETDMPWSAPAAWEGTMPLPGGYMNRYE
ncbi:MAG: hypothetical protein PHV28_04305 [Kiritimatiellae bacterium]|nr:hypothetical protein [Kiritimatiellia bacterium]